MTRLETILKEAESLSAGERAQLLATLIQTSTDAETDEVAAAQRGLAAWTASARNESWSEYYPDNLRNGRRNSK